MNPSEPRSGAVPFAAAMQSIKETPPIAARGGEPISADAIAEYQQLFESAGIPLSTSDVDRYASLLTKHGPLGLASRPEIFAQEAIGVAALADLHRAPDARRIAAMDAATLESEMEERSRMPSARPTARREQAADARQSQATLLRVRRDNEPEMAVNGDFAASGKIVSIDDSHVVMAAGKATFTYRTADLKAAADFSRVVAAKEQQLPVDIRRSNGRVGVTVGDRQQVRSAASPAQTNAPPRRWHIDDKLPEPPTFTPEEEARRKEQRKNTPTLDDVLAVLRTPASAQNRAPEQMPAMPKPTDQRPLNQNDAQRSGPRAYVVQTSGPNLTAGPRAYYAPIIVDKAPGTAAGPAAPKQAVRDIRPDQQQKPSEIVLENPAQKTPSGENRRKAVELNADDKFSIQGRFVTKTQIGEKKTSVGLVFKDKNDRLVHLSPEHTAALLKSTSTKKIVEQSLQSGAQAPALNVSFAKGKWSVAAPDASHKHH